MGRQHSTCWRLSARAAVALLAVGPVLASAQTWSGAGPFPPGTGSRTVHAITVDRATGAVFAGVGSGTVFALNDASLSEPPVASNDSNVVAPEASVVIDVLANDSDPEGALDAASVEIQTPPAHGDATPDGAGAVTYTPDAGYVGPDSFTYTVRDLAGNESNEASVNLRVNTLPVAGADTASTQEDEPVTIDVLANDSDADGAVDPAEVMIWNSPANGGATVEADGRITYEPAPGFSGVDSFTYRVADNDGGLSNEATVSITVTAAPNAAPVAQDDSAGVMQGEAVTINVLGNDTDGDGTLDPATVTIQTAPGDGVAIVNASGAIVYTPNADFSGVDSFTYTVADDDGDTSNAATVAISVAAIGGSNSPPVAANDSVNTVQGAAVTIAVLSNDSDADGGLDPTAVAVQSAPANGAAAVNADGSITYTPDAGFTGADTFTYTVADDDGETSNAATVTVTVIPGDVNNSPPAALNDAATTETGVPVTIDVLANDSDDDGSIEPTTVAVLDAPVSGSAAVNGDGSITYTPAAGFIGDDSFTYTVLDNEGAASNAAAVAVSVVSATSDDPPPSTPPRRGGGGSGGLPLLAMLALALGARRRFQVKP